MKTIQQKASMLLEQHSALCIADGRDFHAGVYYFPEFSYEYDENSGETVFNQPFHDAMLKVGIVDSEQTQEEKHELGQRLIIPTKVLENLIERAAILS